MTQATLPPTMIERTIALMKKGESAWCVPWGMWVDSDLKCWLHPDYTLHDRPMGTVQMLIEKTKEGFYECTIPKDQKYHGSEGPTYSNNDKNWIPVSKLNFFN